MDCYHPFIGFYITKYVASFCLAHMLVKASRCWLVDLTTHADNWPPRWIPCKTNILTSLFTKLKFYCFPKKLLIRRHMHSCWSALAILSQLLVQVVHWLWNSHLVKCQPHSLYILLCRTQDNWFPNFSHLLCGNKSVFFVIIHSLLASQSIASQTKDMLLSVVSHV